MNNNLSIEKRKSNIKSAVQIIFFTSLTALAFLYIFINNPEPGKIFANISQIKVFPFFTTLLVVFFLSVLDGLCIFVLSKQYNKKYQVISGISNALTSNFVGVFNKTAATVIQTSTLTKQGMKVSKSFSIITMYFLIYQFSLVLYSLYSFFVSYPRVNNIKLDNIIPGLPISVLSLIGLSINTGILILILLFAFSKRIHRFILTSFVDFLAKLHLLKNPESTRNKLATRIITYHVECSRLLRQKKVALGCISLFLLRFTINNFIPYLTFWILDVYKYQNIYVNFFDLYCGSNFLSLISVYIPTGAPEIAFQTIYSQLLNNSGEAKLIATTGTIVWRILTFFIPFVTGAIFYLINRKKNTSENEVISKTMTLYDLQKVSIVEESKNDKLVKEYVANLEKSVNRSKKSSLSLLNEDQVRESFSKIKEQIEHKSDVEEINFNQNTVEQQRATLKKVIEETENIISKNKEFDQEIQKEAETERIHQIKYFEKKKNRDAEKKKRKIEKDKKRTNKNTSKKTTIIYDDENGIAIDGPNFFEIRTKQTKIDSDGKEKNNNK